jgi:hypothetical protein
MSTHYLANMLDRIKRCQKHGLISAALPFQIGSHFGMDCLSSLWLSGHLCKSTRNSQRETVRLKALHKAGRGVSGQGKWRKTYVESRYRKRYDSDLRGDSHAFERGRADRGSLSGKYRGLMTFWFPCELQLGGLFWLCAVHVRDPYSCYLVFNHWELFLKVTYPSLQFQLLTITSAP